MSLNSDPNSIQGSHAQVSNGATRYTKFNFVSNLELNLEVTLEDYNRDFRTQCALSTLEKYHFL